MKAWFLIVAPALIAVPVPAAAQQQERMKACHAQAKAQALKGEARKAHMKTCLAGKTPDSAKSQAAASTHQARAGDSKTQRARCEKQANKRDLIGKERRSFMKECASQPTVATRRRDARDDDAKAVRPAPVVTAAQTPDATREPAAQSSATPPPSVAAADPRTAPGSAERRSECFASREYQKAAVQVREVVLSQCMAAP
jgi:hypothetical protein